ncbi:reverse transcriptase [Senna tora]|uniref:Reverse transcriptase n=1 Tax=Senna tora TaxID=362788 RepID=A0A834TKP7_9FABA|nr:reverse transcriptase [Senna tora]
MGPSSFTLSGKFVLLETQRSFLLQFDLYRIDHAHRETNRCADFLARNAVLSRTPFVIFHTVPNDLFLVFWADLSGIKYTRNCRGTFDPV